MTCPKCGLTMQHENGRYACECGFSYRLTAEGDHELPAFPERDHLAPSDIHARRDIMRRYIDDWPERFAESPGPERVAQICGLSVGELGKGHIL